jgi:hypothetical protein
VVTAVSIIDVRVLKLVRGDMQRLVGRGGGRE